MNRAERRSHKERVINKRLKELKALNLNSQYKNYCVKRNLLNKQDAFDCGNSKCIVCNLDKMYSSLDNRGRKRRDNKYKGDLEDET